MDGWLCEEAWQFGVESVVDLIIYGPSAGKEGGEGYRLSKEFFKRKQTPPGLIKESTLGYVFFFWGYRLG